MAVKRGRGRPTKYQARFCELLIEHMRAGKTLESFGAHPELGGIGKNTLYQWRDRHPEFQDAITVGRGYMEDFYIDLGLSMATGQLKRLVSEEPLYHPDGRPIIDPKTRKQAVKREWDSAKTNAAAYIFLTKNVLNWRDRKDVNHGGQPEGVPVEVKTSKREMTREERLGEIERLRAMRETCGDD